ncbi:MAG: hypothetical protein WC121_08825 [Candidatus Kapaibacterium sp.]
MKKLILLTMLLPFLLLAEEKVEKPDMGFTVVVQQSTFDLQIPMWLSDRFILAPAIGTRYQDNLGTEIDFGLGARIFTNDKSARPYFGLKAGLIYTSFEANTPSLMDIIVGPSYGVEYFFNSNISLGIEGQLNFVFFDENSLRFSNPSGLNINTAAVLFASIYF